MGESGALAMPAQKTLQRLTLQMRIRPAKQLLLSRCSEPATLQERELQRQRAAHQAVLNAKNRL